MVCKEKINKNFSKHANTYDKYASVQDICAKELISRVNSSNFKNIIDLGCGTGNYTNLLRNKFLKAKIKAVDISPEMIKYAKTKIGENGVEFLVKDAEKYKFNEKFDLISSNASFQWFSDLDGYLNKCRDALSQGGVILFSSFGPETFKELHKTLEIFYGDNLEISAMSFVGKTRLKAICKQLFKTFSIEEKTYKFKYNSLAELLKEIKYTGTSGSGLAKKVAWTKNNILKIEEIYKSNFKEIVASYQVFFCRGVN